MSETRKYIERIEALVRQFDQSADPKTKSDATELVQSLLDLHGASLARIVSLLESDGAGGRELLSKLLAEEDISSLLILYGLHPVPFACRVRTAIEKLQPQLQSHDASVETVSIGEETVRLRLISKSNGCHSRQIKELVEAAIIDAAPDVLDLQIEEVTLEPKPVLVPLKGLNKEKTAAGTRPPAI